MHKLCMYVRCLYILICVLCAHLSRTLGQKRWARRLKCGGLRYHTKCSAAPVYITEKEKKK